MNARERIARRIHANHQPTWTTNPDETWETAGQTWRNACYAEADQLIAIAREEAPG